MKRNIVLAVVAILLLALYSGIVALLFLLILPLAYFFLKQKEKREQKEKVDRELSGTVLERYTSLEAVVAEYGEPDDSVVINASKANEPAGIILIYAKKGFLIVDGEKINMADIIGVSAKNMATPYTIGEYQIIFTTGIKGRELIRINAGYDARWAGDAVGQIHKYLCQK